MTVTAHDITRSNIKTPLVIPMDHMRFHGYLDGRQAARDNLIQHLGNIIHEGQKVSFSVSKNTNLSDPNNNFADFFMGFFEVAILSIKEKHFSNITNTKEVFGVTSLNASLYKKFFKDHFKLLLECAQNTLFPLVMNKDSEPVIQLSDRDIATQLELSELIIAFHKAPETYYQSNFDIANRRGAMIASPLVTRMPS